MKINYYRYHENQYHRLGGYACCFGPTRYSHHKNGRGYPDLDILG